MNIISVTFGIVIFCIKQVMLLIYNLHITCLSFAYCLLLYTLCFYTYFKVHTYILPVYFGNLLNGPLDNFMQFLFVFQHLCIVMHGAIKFIRGINLCNRRLTCIINLTHKFVA